MLEGRISRAGRGFAAAGLTIGLLVPLISPEQVFAGRDSKKISMTAKASCELKGGIPEDPPPGFASIVTLQIERPAGAEVSKVEVKRGNKRLRNPLVTVESDRVEVKDYGRGVEDSRTYTYSAKLKFDGKGFKTKKVEVTTLDCNP